MRNRRETSRPDGWIHVIGHALFGGGGGGDGDDDDDEEDDDEVGTD